MYECQNSLILSSQIYIFIMRYLKVRTMIKQLKREIKSEQYTFILFLVRYF